MRETENGDIESDLNEAVVVVIAVTDAVTSSSHKYNIVVLNDWLSTISRKFKPIVRTICERNQ